MSFIANPLRVDLNLYIFLIGISLLLFLISSLVADAFAVNQTAIDEIQSDLSSEITPPASFPVVWVIFLLVVLAFFMYASIRQRWDREMVFFSIGATIISIMLTLLFTAPVDFDFQSTNSAVIVVERNDNGTIVYDSQVVQTLDRVILIPNTESFRFAFMALFTGIGMFNGLYSIFIITGFSIRGDWGRQTRE